MKTTIIRFLIALITFCFSQTTIYAQSGSFPDQETIDAAFKAELINLGFENGEYPDVPAQYQITDQLIHLTKISALGPDGKIIQGFVPTDRTTEDVVQASALACAASINQLKMAAGGDLSNIRKIANIRYTTQTIPSYFDYIPASNSCSTMMLRVFGDNVGSHTRHAEGQMDTEGNQTFQIEMYVYLK